MTDLAGPRIIFSEPHFHFYVVQNTLRCLDIGVEIHFDKENHICGQKQSLRKISYYYGWTLKSLATNVISFLTSLKGYLSARKYTPYHLAVMQLRWEYGLSFPVPILNQPFTCFRQLNGIIFYHNNGQLQFCFLQMMNLLYQNLFPEFQPKRLDCKTLNHHNYQS